MIHIRKVLFIILNDFNQHEVDKENF